VSIIRHVSEIELGEFARAEVEPLGQIVKQGLSGRVRDACKKELSFLGANSS
jgi:hypothetical protein